jgi:hypothetical protein
MIKYCGIMTLVCLYGCGKSYETGLEECSKAEQQMFSSCIVSGCSASYSEDASGAKDCNISAEGTVISVSGGAECSFSDSGSCFIVCDCPEGTDIEIVVENANQKDTSGDSDTSSDLPDNQEDDTGKSSGVDTSSADSSSDDTSSHTDSGGDVSAEDDWDRDGFTELEGDCDDASSAVNPYASDAVGDGNDQNCDGIDGVDADLDGYASTSSGGSDCDDLDYSVLPGAVDLKSDGIDANCDGDDEDTIRFKNIYTFSSISDSYSEIDSIGDLNGDGYTDLIITMYGLSTYPKYYMSGASIKSRMQTYTKFYEPSIYSSGSTVRPRLSIKDYNGDGYLDVLSDYLFDGLDLSVGLITKSVKRCGVATGTDYDMDGDEDVALMGSYYYYMNNMSDCINGTISTSSPIDIFSKIEAYTTASGYRLSSYGLSDIGDCNGDGSSDIIYQAQYTPSGYASSAENYISMELGGTHMASRGYVYGDERPTDRDGDGLYEFLIQTGTSYSVIGMYRCVSSGSYKSQVIDSISYSLSAYAGDIDNDMDNEYVVYSPSTGDWTLRISDSNYYNSPNEYNFDSVYFSSPTSFVIGNWDSDPGKEVVYVDTSGNLSVADIDI